MAYPNFLANKFDFACINLGFSGNAKGEDVMSDYIAGLAPDVLVMDYDHNAPNAAHLQSTHERFFLRFREKNPQAPVIFLSAPNVRIETAFDCRRPIVRATYEKALARGDKNVYYIDGYDLFGEEDWDSCMVDGCHPNDLGHYRMAMHLAPIFKKIFG
jgi:lysophospholipase L1-like esterase